jgi:transposase
VCLRASAPSSTSRTARSCNSCGYFLGTGMTPTLSWVRSLHQTRDASVAWADQLDGQARTWAVESAGGLGYLLSQQLLAAGEHEIFPRRWCRGCGCWETGRSDKNDPNDARSVAIAALRAPALTLVRVEDHATVLRLLARRHSQIAWARNQAVCRLHALVGELVAGGIGKEIVVSQAFALLAGLEPSGAVGRERRRLALELVDDVARYDEQRKESKRRIRAAVAASGTTLTEIFGIGDVIAATLIGHAGDPFRFANEDKFAAYNGTAPVEWSSGNPKRPIHRLSRCGNRAINHALHIAAVTQIRFAHSPGRGFYDRKLAEGHTPKEAIRALKRRISNVVYRHLIADAQPASRHR